MNFINRMDDSLFVYGEKIILYEGSQKKKKETFILYFEFSMYLCTTKPGH